MDWNIPQHYEEIKPIWEQSSTQEQLNKLIEEQRKIIIKWMDDDLRSGWKYEEIKNDLKYDVVWNIWVVIYKWIPDSWYKYSKENWVEYYTNLEWLQEDDDLQFALKESWYNLNNLKLYQKWQEITQFLLNWRLNPDFVKWIDNIKFYAEIQNTFWLMLSVIGWDKIEFDTASMNLSIVRWVARIEDIIYFYEKWYIPKEEIQKLLIRSIKELPNQCSDTRLYQNVNWKRMWFEVTKQELDAYLSWKPITLSIKMWNKPTEEELKKYIELTWWKPLITKELYDNCLKRIELRDRKIAEMNWIKEESKTERKIEWTRNSFIDKVKGILER